MAKIMLSIGALALATSLGACTHEAQRDTLTGALAGTTVGMAQAAIEDESLVQGMWRGAAIGGGVGLLRNVIETTIDGGYGNGYGSGYGYPQSSQGYQEPFYSAGYGAQPANRSPSPYGGAPVYRDPNPYYQQQSRYPDPYNRGYRY